MDRSTTYKDKIAKGLKSNMGLYSYPILYVYIFKHPLLYTRIQLILRRRATIRKLSFVKCGISCDNHFKFKERNEMIGFE